MKVLRGCTNAFGKIVPKPQVRSGLYVPSVYNFIVHSDETLLTNTLSRSLVVLTDSDEDILKQKEISKILGIGLPLVKYRIRRAKELLEQLIGKEDAT